MKKQYKFLIRVDASAKIGWGHAMRCFALATELKKAGAVVQFITRDFEDNSIVMIKNGRFPVEKIPSGSSQEEDLRLTLQLADDLGPDMIIVDGYLFTRNYLQRLKRSGRLLLCIDDIAHTFFPCDILLNQNLNASREMYYSKVKPDTILLLGPQYVLLRNEFSRAQKIGLNSNDVVKKVLVTMGGSGSYGQTIRVLKALDAAKSNFDILVIINANMPRAGQLSDFIKSSTKKINIVKDANNMADLMLKCDLAITAGGITCWELACLGIPNITILLADNQRGVANELGKRDITYNLGWHSEVTQTKISEAVDTLVADPPRRRSMSMRGHQLINGRGAEKVRMEIEKLLEIGS